MENPKWIKRSIRLPKDINHKLVLDSIASDKTVNQIIIDLIGQKYGIPVEFRKRGRRGGC